MAGFRPNSKSGSSKKHASAGDDSSLLSMIFNMFANEEEDESDPLTDGNPVMIGLTGNDFPSYCAA